MNHKRLKELRLSGEEKCEPEFDPKNTQVPDGDIVNCHNKRRGNGI